MVGRTANEHFEMLDALRGVAALVVMLHHVVPAMTHVQSFNSGYLAVDFFFMLSGLVIANAWEDRLADGTPLRRFVAARVRRVYPMIALGILAGATVELLNGADVAATAAATLRHLLFWPTMDGDAGVFPLDGVEWSLPFELFANLVFATVLFRLPTRILALLAVGAVIALLVLADGQQGIAVGDRPATLLLGIPRVLATYLPGVLLFRLLREGRAPGVALPIGAVPPLLVVALVAPGLLRGWIGPSFADPLVAVLVFPAIILAACRPNLPAGWTEAARLGAAASFPLYALHLPLLCLLIGPRVGMTGVAGAIAAVALTLAISLVMATGMPTHSRPPWPAPIPA